MVGPTEVAQTVMVRVALLPSPPPSAPPPPHPHLLPAPAIVAIAPRFNVVPPPPDAIRATPQPPPVQNAGSAPPPKPASPPAPADYLSALAAHLNAYKTYPYEARVRREGGVVRLRFSLDRAGHVLSFDVVGSSGSAALDGEVRAMIRRADPFPPMPPQIPGDTLDLVVPVIFSLH